MKNPKQFLKEINARWAELYPINWFREMKKGKLFRSPRSLKC